MINQPENLRVTTKDGSATFTWNPNFSTEWQGRYDNAQRIVNQDVLEFCEPYIPVKSGRLLRSGRVDDENGLVTWTTPYASFRYYMPQKKLTGLRGSFWFARMKASKINTIVQDAQKEIG